jgi:phosphatidylglycerophosphatase C
MTKVPDNIAAFDFDGTITTKDSLFQFIIHCVGWPKFIIGLVKLLPTLLKYFLKQINNETAKEALFAIYFKGVPYQQFLEFGEKFEGKINRFLNNKALNKITYHKNLDHRVVIVSASINIWIMPWANR